MSAHTPTMSRRAFKREALSLTNGNTIKAVVLRNSTEGLGGYKPLQELAKLLRRKNSVVVLCTIENEAGFLLEAYKV